MKTYITRPTYENRVFQFSTGAKDLFMFLTIKGVHDYYVGLIPIKRFMQAWEICSQHNFCSIQRTPCFK